MCICVSFCEFEENTRCNIPWQSVCVSPILDRQREAEWWPVPGWDQVSAASSRDGRGIECFPFLLYHSPSPSSLFSPLSLFPTFNSISLLYPSVSQPLATSFPVSFSRFFSVCRLHFSSTNLSHSRHFFFHSFSASASISQTEGCTKLWGKLDLGCKGGVWWHTVYS